MTCPNTEFSMNNKREISQYAGEGSDIHNLLRKVAYNLYQMRPENSAEENWFSAQSMLLYWTENASCAVTLPHGLSEYLNSQERIGRIGRNASLEKTADDIIELASKRHY